MPSQGQILARLRTGWGLHRGPFYEPLGHNRPELVQSTLLVPLWHTPYEGLADLKRRLRLRGVTVQCTFVATGVTEIPPGYHMTCEHSGDLAGKLDGFGFGSVEINGVLVDV